MPTPYRISLRARKGWWPHETPEGHDQDAQDVVQDAYIRALKGFHLFRCGNSRGWLLTIVRNTAYTFLNRRAAEEEKLIRYEEEKPANIISIDNPDNKLLAEGRKEYLQRALERSDDPAR